MDSPPPPPSDEPPRVKFLVSFGGTILPRPLDGRLRYVGGETRIVSLPRSPLSFPDLLSRMRDLFESDIPSTLLIKYQQPDEDLDALVSLVNDDDLINMLEEYDKLLPSDNTALTRLRLFLFSPSDNNSPSDYVDALNADAADPHLTIHIPSDPPWSPAAYFSPSTSSARHHAADFSDDYSRHQSPPYIDNMVWGASIADKSGFPTTLGHAHHVFDGGCACEHCRMALQRAPDPRYLDPRWMQQPNMEHGNEYMGGHVSNSCGECYRKNQDHRQFYNEPHVHDRGWMLHHQHAGHPIEDPRVHRVGEHYAGDGNAMNVSFKHGNFYDGHSAWPSNSINHEDTRYPQPGSEFGTEVYHVQQSVGGGLQPHMSGFEDSTIRYGNRPPAYGADNLYQVAQNLPPIQSIRRKVQVPMHPGTSYESQGLMMPNGGMNSSYIRSPQDVSPRLSRIAMENQIQNSWAGQNGSTSQKVLGIDGAAPDYPYDHGPRSNRNIIGPDGRLSVLPDPVQCQPGTLYVEVPYEGVPLAPTLVDDKMVASTAFGHHPVSEASGTDVAPPLVEVDELKDDDDILKESYVQASLSPDEKHILDSDSNKMKPTEGDGYSVKVAVNDANAGKEQGDISVECLGFLPELIDSVKKATLESIDVVKARAEANAEENLSAIPETKEVESVEVIKARAEENADENVSAIPEKKEASHELEPGNACMDFVADSDGDGEKQNISKIEPTTAESEALAKGLQTIRNDDLEEIRELGSGTYGSVYHGKWKGSDVAIKRIKASCFTGRPSERERLIADFWKEALILSSLHHPNVVSFYGVVRDGPDGSLATVTEFMINGSLKQFLQKKDRTIDRRKRLILAMDAAFGMEYLHGKNIVHFDLKCENLLVNMRDPHRPVCKIGDLGLSKVKQRTLVSGGVRGTLPWMAPELLSGKSHMVTEKIDVYSFGIVMWELLTGEDPYADMHCASMIGGIINNTLRPQVPTWCDPEWKALMENCWSSDPGERPSFAEISQKLRKMAAAINLK